MKTLQRALNIAACTSIACWYFDFTAILTGVIACSLMILILPAAYYVCGDAND